MLGIGRNHRGAIARLAVFGLLFQAFFAALHLPGIRAADAAAGEAGSIVICSGGGLQRIPLPGGDQSSGGQTHWPGSVSCPICLSLSCCALAMPAAWTADAPAPLKISLLMPAAAEVLHDHRQAIRPGHGPPASV
jgi:Protein of unknown function (DUF2946)